MEGGAAVLTRGTGRLRQGTPAAGEGRLPVDVTAGVEAMKARETMRRDRGELRGYALVAMAALMWGTVGVMAKFLYGWGMSPWSLVYFRSAVTALMIGGIILAVNPAWLRVRRADIPFLVVYAALGSAAFFAFYFFTISLTTVAVAVVLLYTAPAFATVIARFTLGEVITPVKLIAVSLSFVGCALVAEIGTIGSAETVVQPLGVLTGLGAAITYALFGIMSKHARKSYNTWTVLFYAMGIATLFLSPILLLPDFAVGPYPPEAYLILAVMILGPTLLSRLFYVEGIKSVEASRAAIVATVEPVAASIFAFLILGEYLSTPQLLGGLLVLGGAMLAQQRR
jgi:drug/metabolite transporter, DME family